MASPNVLAATTGHLLVNVEKGPDSIEFIVLEDEHGKPRGALFPVEHRGERVYVRAEHLRAYVAPNVYDLCMMIAADVRNGRQDIFYTTAHKRLHRKGIQD